MKNDEEIQSLKLKLEKALEIGDSLWYAAKAAQKVIENNSEWLRLETASSEWKNFRRQ